MDLRRTHRLIPAHTHYDRRRAAGDGHPAALRNLAAASTSNNFTQASHRRSAAVASRPIKSGEERIAAYEFYSQRCKNIIGDVPVSGF